MPSSGLHRTPQSGIHTHTQTYTHLDIITNKINISIKNKSESCRTSIERPLEMQITEIKV